jgi:hypothetical protein
VEAPRRRVVRARHQFRCGVGAEGEPVVPARSSA